MFRVSFNDGWEFRPKASSFAELGRGAAPYRRVTLPHDAMIGQQRVAPDGDATGAGGASGYFPGAPSSTARPFCAGGAPGQADPGRVRGRLPGRDGLRQRELRRAAPLRVLAVPYRRDRFLRFGAGNEIRVEARAHKDSRWYTGAGIYRGTWLLTGDLVRIAPDRIRVTTPTPTPSGRSSRSPPGLRTIRSRSGRRASAPRSATPQERRRGDTCQVSVLPGEPATARQRLYVRAPVLLEPESPALYTAHVTLTGDEGRRTRGVRQTRRRLPSASARCGSTPHAGCGSTARR